MNREQFYNATLENDLLSILINDYNVLGEVLGIPSDIFYYKQNKLLYEVVESLWRDNKAINPSTIYGVLKTDIDKVGGITRISELTINYINSIGYKQIINSLEDYKKRRELYKTKDSIEKLLTDEIDTKEIIQKINDEMTKIANGELEEDTGDIDNDISELGNILEERYKQGSAISGIPTKLTSLDFKINGLNKQQLIIIGGRPGSGKTTLVNNIALKVADQQKHVAIFNLEMSKQQILETLLANVSVVENEKLRIGNLNDSDWEKVAIGQSKLFKLNKYLKIFDTVTTLDRIVANTKKLHKQGKLDVLIVDYLQLISNGNGRNREQEVADISRKLKLLSKDLGITVIALSQLSRTCEQRADKRPILSDLRESGSIEQDADIVMFTYRDEYYNADTEEKNVIEVIVGKQRNGTVGTVKLSWIPQFFRVSNLIRI